MCGIAGIVWGTDSREQPWLEKRVWGMMGAMVHRGPDDWGMVSIGNGARVSDPGWDGHMTRVPGAGSPLVLGHRRLSILDLSSAGRQPMSSPDGRYWIVLNGEIYNFIELRGELERDAGITFRTDTDTEVLLEGYRCWHRGVLGKLDGMFAFAIWDTRARRLFCARDPMGIKPFYFSTQSGRFIFASEPRAVLAGLGTTGHVDGIHLAEFLVLGVTDHDEGTFFREVSQLPGGCWMTIDERAGISPFHRYWSPPGDLLNGDADVPRLLAEQLQVSVKRQLRSDVPVGSCLSGGLDSGAIAITVGELLGGSAKSYTALTLRAEGFPDDESELARATAMSAGMNWHPVDVDMASLGDDVEAMATAMGEPFSTLSMFAQYKVMESAARLGLKVMLDGQGGDEVYVGYGRIVQRVVRDYLRAAQLRSAFDEWGALSVNASIPRWRSLAGNLFFSNPALALARNRRRMAPFVPESVTKLARLEVAERLFNRGSQRKAQAIELMSTCLPRLLRYEDRNSMAFSVEARVPHLAVGIVDLTLRFPPEWRVRNGWSKYALRKAMEGRLPDEILWNRVKRGFDVPQGEWVQRLRPRIDGWLSAVSRDAPIHVEAILKGLDTGLGGCYWFWRCLSVVLWFNLTGVKV